MKCSVRIEVPSDASVPEAAVDMLRSAVIDRLNRAARESGAVFYGIHIGCGEWRVLGGMFIERRGNRLSTVFEPEFKSDDSPDLVILHIAAERIGDFTGVRAEC